MRRLLRFAVRAGLGVVAAGIVYVAVTFLQIVLASHSDDARPAGAIVVLGAAQYNGRPSPVLRARLDHATDLYRRNLAPLVVVTGGRQPGDQFTEATASANYLLGRGIPDANILREVSGRSTWESLAAAARILRARGLSNVLLVSDPFHSKRVVLIAEELHLHAHASPARNSPIHGVSAYPYYLRETAAVAAGRIVGFRRLVGIEGKAALRSAATYSGVV